MKSFELTEDHLKLLRSAYIRWENCEYGAPAIDCKRPYGNSSVELDIAEILGWNVSEELTEFQEQKAREIHEGTMTALQIILKTGKFQSGYYQKDNDYGEEWCLVEDDEAS